MKFIRDKYMKHVKMYKVAFKIQKPYKIMQTCTRFDNFL